MIWICKLKHHDKHKWAHRKKGGPRIGDELTDYDIQKGHGTGWHRRPRLRDLIKNFQGSPNVYTWEGPNSSLAPLSHFDFPYFSLVKTGETMRGTILIPLVSSYGTKATLALILLSKTKTPSPKLPETQTYWLPYHPHRTPPSRPNFPCYLWNLAKASCKGGHVHVHAWAKRDAKTGF